MKKLLSLFTQKSLTVVITLIAVVLTLTLMELIYYFLGEVIRPVSYAVAVVVPLIVAPLMTWHIFGLLVTLIKTEEERRRLVEALHEAKERLTASQRIAKLGSWHLDLRADRLFWSDEIYHIFEIDPERFGASYEAFLQLIHPDDRDAVNEAYRNSLKHKEPYKIEHRLLMPDGRIKYVREEGQSQYDDEGNAISSEGTVQEITEQVLLQQENEKKQEILSQQTKMAQMGEMLNSIAHQWKQPLAQVNSILMEMDGRFGGEKFTRDYFHNRLDRIEELTTYMSNTIEEFRTYFHPNKLKTVFNADEVVQMALALFDPVLKASNIRVITDRMKPYRLEGYKQELAQVLLVLLGNACEALDDEDISQPTVEIAVVPKNGQVRIVVKDNGKGIPRSLLDRIFEPYFTTKEHRGGTGIGLYMAKMIVEKSMNGELLVESSPSGSTFTIVIDKV